MRSLESPGRERIVALRSRVQQFFDAEVEDGVAQGVFSVTAPHEAARAVVTMCTGLAQWFSSSGPSTAEQVAAWYVEFALGLMHHQG